MRISVQLILFSAIVLTGCAQMTVDVSILDRRFWSSPEQLGNAVSDQVATMMRRRANGEFDRTRQTLKAKAHDTLVELSKPICIDPAKRTLTGCVDPALVESLYAPLAASIDKAFADADLEFNKAFATLASAASTSSSEARATKLFEAQSYIDQGYSLIRRVNDDASAQLRKPIEVPDVSAGPSPGDRASNVVAKAQAQMQQAVSSVVGEQGILNDPLASSVVYAPESFWRRTESPTGINNTSASGTFGNTDIAIKMESVGSYTIKGVRLDASKITQATFAVGRQAIKTVAAIYGIPMPASAGGTTATTPTAPFAEAPIGFASPDRRRAAADEALLRRRLARISILETIVIQRDALTNPATDAATESARATAIKTVKDTYAANRADLDAPTK